MSATRPALFLDRDGIVNVDRGYVHTLEQFEFVDGIFDLVRAALRRGWPAVVVTNQSGIGRGYYGEDDFQRLTAWMHDRFAQAGAPIARVYHCPAHPDAGSPDRKPAPGMLLRARDDLGLDLPRSVLVGDQDSDSAAGRAAGVGSNWLLGRDVATLHEAAERLARLPGA